MYSEEPSHRKRLAMIQRGIFSLTSSNRAEVCGIKRAHCSSAAFIKSFNCSALCAVLRLTRSRLSMKQTRRIDAVWDDASAPTNARWSVPSSHCETCGARKSMNQRLELGLEPEISLNRWCVITTVQLHAQTQTELLKC